MNCTELMRGVGPLATPLAGSSHSSAALACFRPGEHDGRQRLSARQGLMNFLLPVLCAWVNTSWPPVLPAREGAHGKGRVAGENQKPEQTLRRSVFPKRPRPFRCWPDTKD